MDPLNLLVTEDASVVFLLTTFIVLLLTKRIVPWWMYEDAIDKLKKYEEAAPGLVDRVDKLSETIDAWYDEQQYEDYYEPPPPRTRNDTRPRRRRSSTYPQRRGNSREEQ